MPILKHAIKKLRVDGRRTVVNKQIKNKAKRVVKQMRQSPSEENLRQVFRVVDRAAKRGVFHRRKADRIKARVSRLVKVKKVKRTKK